MRKIGLAAAMACLCAHQVTALGLSTGVELPKGTPIPVLVEFVNAATEELGLSRDFIRSKVELELRRNGLTPKTIEDSDDCYLYINISVIGVAFDWEVSFRRWVTYEVKGVKYSKAATTYEKQGLGRHGQNAEFVSSQVLSGVDIVSNEILKSFK